MEVEDAKQRLLEEDGVMREGRELIRRHPKEAVVVSAAIGVVIGASPRLRRALLDTLVGVLRVLR